MLCNYKRIEEFGLVGGIGKGGSFNKKNLSVSYSLCRPKAKELKTESIEEFKARGGQVNRVDKSSYVPPKKAIDKTGPCVIVHVNRNDEGIWTPCYVKKIA